MKKWWTALLGLCVSTLCAGEGFQFQSAYYSFHVDPEFTTRYCDSTGAFVKGAVSFNPRVCDAKGNLILRVSKLNCWTWGPNAPVPAGYEKISDRQVKMLFRPADPGSSMKAEMCYTFNDGPCIRMDFLVDTRLDPKFEEKERKERKNSSAKPKKNITVFF